jgi:hypothetical protein
MAFDLCAALPAIISKAVAWAEAQNSFIAQ